MAAPNCAITAGRLLPCKDAVGGLKAIYLVNYGTFGTITYDATNSDMITSFDDGATATPDAYRYDIKGANSFTTNITSSSENRTTFFEQQLEVTLPKLTPEQHQEIKLLSYGRPHIIVEDYNDNFFVAGLENGCDVTAGTIVTGAAMGDLSGYTLTFTAMEKLPANFVDANDEAGLILAGLNIVAGV